MYATLSSLRDNKNSSTINPSLKQKKLSENVYRASNDLYYLQKGTSVGVKNHPFEVTRSSQYKYTDSVNTHRPYHRIEIGDIVYSESDLPFVSPNFHPSTVFTKTMYTDPMGRQVTGYEKAPSNYKSELLWLADTTNQRETVMALQMRKRFNEKY